MVKVQKRLSQELDKYNPSEHQWRVNEGCKITLSKTRPPPMQLENFMQLLHSVFHRMGFPPSVPSRGKRAAFSSDISLMSSFSSIICPPALPKEQDGQIILLFVSVSPPISLTGKGSLCPEWSSVLRDSAQSL